MGGWKKVFAVPVSPKKWSLRLYKKYCVKKKKKKVMDKGLFHLPERTPLHHPMGEVLWHLHLHLHSEVTESEKTVFVVSEEDGTVVAAVATIID